MMNIGPAMRLHLIADAGVTALIGSRCDAVNTRKSHGTPRIIFQQISNKPMLHQGGQAGLWVSRMQVESWADTDEVAHNLANAVDAAFGGGFLRETIGSGSSTADVRSAEQDGEFDDEEPVQDGSEKRVYVVRQDWIFNYA